VTGGWRKLQNEELHNMYSSQSIITTIARLGRRRMDTEFSWESQKERDHYQDLDIGGKIILQWVVER
jgi:hypothetical protein